MDNLIKKLDSLLKQIFRKQDSFSQYPFKRVLVPVSGFAIDQEAISLAMKITNPEGVIFAVYVSQIPLDMPLSILSQREVTQGELTLNRIKSAALKDKIVVETEMLQARAVGPALLLEAEERNVDLIIMGTQYTKHHGIFSLGEIVPYVLENSLKPVWILRGSREGIIG
jgi:nucleotide-binding universal stress UspA family protein